MEVAIVDLKNQETGKKKLPAQFNEGIRPDLIKRAVLAILSNQRQAYGSDPEAGQKASAKLSRRRRKYRGSYGMGISRVPRKILSRRGTRMYWVGAVAPGTVGGRRAHPPKAEKIWELKINKKENRKAIRSALSATIIEEVVKERGHLIPEKFPLIIKNDIEDIKTTKELKSLLVNYGLETELEVNKKVRQGKGKARSRKYKTRRGILIVVSKDCDLLKAVKNLAGVEASIVNELNAEILAPGTAPGRLTLYSEGAIEKLEKENLFN